MKNLARAILKHHALWPLAALSCGLALVLLVAVLSGCAPLTPPTIPVAPVTHPSTTPPAMNALTITGAPETTPPAPRPRSCAQIPVDLKAEFARVTEIPTDREKARKLPGEMMVSEARKNKVIGDLVTMYDACAKGGK